MFAKLEFRKCSAGGVIRFEGYSSLGFRLCLDDLGSRKFSNISFRYELCFPNACQFALKCHNYPCANPFKNETLERG